MVKKMRLEKVEFEISKEHLWKLCLQLAKIGSKKNAM
jgi:hypothetical protein